MSYWKCGSSNVMLVFRGVYIYIFIYYIVYTCITKSIVHHQGDSAQLPRHCGCRLFLKLRGGIDQDVREIILQVKRKKKNVPIKKGYQDGAWISIVVLRRCVYEYTNNSIDVYIYIESWYMSYIIRKNIYILFGLVIRKKLAMFLADRL